jgi:hypothetical protein
VFTAFLVGGDRSGQQVNPFTSAGSTAGLVIAGPSRDVAGSTGFSDADGFGGCGNFDGNGSGNDIDLLSSITNSMNPGENSAGNPTGSPGNPPITPSPDYGGSTNVQDTVLRTGVVKLGVLAGGDIATVPADGDTQDITVGASGGKANLFGTPVNGLGSGNSVDVTIGAVQGYINSIARQVDGAFPGPAGSPNSKEKTGNISAYFNCRQAWTGRVKNTLTDIKLKGKLAISPALTADGHVRIAKVSLTGNGSSRQALAACLSPYQLYMSGNPLLFPSNLAGLPAGAYPNPYEGGLTDTSFVGPQLMGAGASSFNPLAVLLGSHLGNSAAPAVDCDNTGGPLQRDPFNYNRIVPSTTYNSSTQANLKQLLDGGGAVAVSGDLKVQKVRGEVLIGQGF